MPTDGGLVARSKDAVASIAAQIGQFEPGPRAALRRMNPDAPDSAALGILLGLLQKAEAGAPDDDVIRRWALVAQVAAMLVGTGRQPAHSPAHPAGEALFRAGYSELRLMRLTSAQGPALRDQIRRMARFLAAARAAPLDLRPIAALVLFDGRDRERMEAARLRLARAYYSAEHARTRDTAATNDMGEDEE
jgi:hypothetical protein